MKRYFMAYAWESRPPGLAGLGCCTVEDGEHPAAKVVRWCKDYQNRRFVLLWWKKIGADIAQIDNEIYLRGR